MFSEGYLFFCVFLSILYLHFCTGANILPFSRELAGLGLPREVMAFRGLSCSSPLKNI